MKPTSVSPLLRALCKVEGKGFIIVVVLLSQLKLGLRPRRAVRPRIGVWRVRGAVEELNKKSKEYKRLSTVFILFRGRYNY